MHLSTRQEVLNASLAKRGISEPEYAVFCVLPVLSGQVLLPDLAGEIKCVYNSNFGQLTRQKCLEGIHSCLNKGWIQVIHEGSLLAISGMLRAKGVLRPLCGMPEPETVDFTEQGAALLGSLHAYPSTLSCSRDFAEGGPYHQKVSHYFPNKQAARTFQDASSKLDWVTTVAGPFPIGAWRCPWWRRFPEGFRVDIEERFWWRNSVHCQDFWGWDRPPDFGLDRNRLQHFLAGRNVQFEEWLVLCVLDGSGRIQDLPRVPHWASEVALERVGLSLDPPAWEAAIEACLKHGWIRVMDAAAAEEIGIWKEGDTALSFLSGQEAIVYGELDYTIAGARLYQGLAREFLGDDWDAGLRMVQNQYRAEQWYTRTEQGMLEKLEELSSGEETILGAQIRPIGPWCTRWWDKFPSGYKLEVELGKS
jgi:hypothetical protein